MSPCAFKYRIFIHNPPAWILTEPQEQSCSADTHVSATACLECLGSQRSLGYHGTDWFCVSITDYLVDLGIQVLLCIHIAKQGMSKIAADKRCCAHLWDLGASCKQDLVVKQHLSIMDTDTQDSDFISEFYTKYCSEQGLEISFCFLPGECSNPQEFAFRLASDENFIVSWEIE